MVISCNWISYKSKKSNITLISTAVMINRETRYAKMSRENLEFPVDVYYLLRGLKGAKLFLT